MKALILAAGQGIRLRPHTLNCPKPLLQCGPHRLIEYHLYRLAAAGFDEAVITTSYRSQDFKKLLGSGKTYGIKITYTMEPPPCFETGGGIIHALPHFHDQPFAVISGDLYTDYPFEQLKKLKTNWGHVYLVQPASGVADFGLDGQKLTLSGPYLYANMGVFHPKVFASWPLCRVSLKQVLHHAHKQHPITAEYVTPQWHNVSTPQQLEQLHRQLLNTPSNMK